MGTTKVLIFWKKKLPCSLNIFSHERNLRKKSEQCCKDLILDLVNNNVFQITKWQMSLFCKVYYLRKKKWKIAHFFVSVSRDRKIWGNERIYFLEIPGPKSLLSLIYIFFLALWGKKEDTTCVWLSSITIVSLKTLSIFFWSDKKCTNSFLSKMAS